MVIYIHGFGGSGEGSKAKAFREYFKSIGEEFIAPSLSYVPKLAIKTLEELIESYHGDVYLIGSSLGGFYATYLSQKKEVKKVVLINPSVNPVETLQKALGDAPSFYDESYYNWNEEHLKMLEEFKLDDMWTFLLLRERGLVLLQKGDELLDYNEAVENYDGVRQIIEDGGSHSFDGIENHFETIRELFAVGDDFKHTCKVKGVGIELDELANRTGDLYYDNLALFLESLSKKLLADSNADREKGREKLANSLLEAVSSINQSIYHINNAWELCEIPTIRWMIENGFNKDINIPKMDNLPPDIMEWYYGRKITMPEELIQEIKRYHDKVWEEINSIDAPMSGVGTKGDLFRFQMGIAYYFTEDYPEYEEEIEAIVYNLIRA